MKLSKTDAQKIADNYNLGEIKKINSINGGWVNYNFDVSTNKGDFIIRIIGGRVFDSWKKEKLKFEFSVLRYLKSKKFPYEIPFPIKNKQGNEVSIFKKRGIWVYEKINGESKRKYDSVLAKEVIKSMAIYHKYIKGFKGKRTDVFDDLEWYFKKYAKLRKVIPKNKTDKLMLDNIDFFEGILRKINKTDFGKDYLIAHNDFHIENLLYENKKAVALLDFDNLEYAPRMNDLAIFAADNCVLNNKLNWKRFNQMKKIYKNKGLSISKKQEKEILLLMLRYYAILFWWFYDGMEKNLDKRHSSIFYAINTSKNIVKNLKASHLQ